MKTTVYEKDSTCILNILNYLVDLQIVTRLYKANFFLADLNVMRIARWHDFQARHQSAKCRGIFINSHKKNGDGQNLKLKHAIK